MMVAGVALVKLAASTFRHAAFCSSRQSESVPKRTCTATGLHAAVRSQRAAAICEQAMSAEGPLSKACDPHAARALSKQAKPAVAKALRIVTIYRHFGATAAPEWTKQAERGARS